MAITAKNKKMIIKGAGKFMAKIPGCDELITMGTLNNMRLDIQLDMLDIEGGESSVPLDTLLRKKVIDITAEDAKFDLNMLRLVLGAKLREGITGAPYKVVSETVVVSDNGGTLTASITGSPITIAGVAPRVIKNGFELDPSNYTLSGSTVTFTGGAADGEIVTVSYPVTAVAQEDGYVWVLEEKHVIKNESGSFKVKLAYGNALYSDNGSKKSHISIITVKENKLLKQINSGSPSEFEYVVDSAAGEITFNSAMDRTDIYVNYKRNEVVDVLDITSKDFPLTVSVVHDGLFEQKDGSIQGFQTELYACRVKSNFTLDAARQQASTHSVTLTVIDPERIDNKLGTIKRYEVVNENMKDICG